MEEMEINRMIPETEAFAHSPWKLPQSCGTTLIAVDFDGGVVIGADSRTSAGSYIVNRVTDKLTEVTETIFCCRSGSAADTQAITDVVKYHMSVYEQIHGRPPTVEVAAQVFRDICYQYRDDLSAGILIGGWDSIEGGQLYSIPLGGMITRRPVASGGSGSTFVAGYLDRNYRKGMTQAECEQLVKEAVTLAMERDGSSGGVCRLGIITEKGIERKLFTREELPKFSQC